ncbi:MAG: DsbA family protein, partial [Actinomycetota bacterium]|nr:DsbA family protein [Actinomycetota bacterium]
SPGLPVVEFFFDPICPWTWLTSRWIVEVAAQTGIDVQWHALSLGLLSSDSLHVTSETSDHLRTRLPISTQALRVVEHLSGQDRNADIGRFYAVLGTALHVDRGEISTKMVVDALRTAGVEDAESAADDPALNAAVEASHARSQSLLAGDSGSPVISIDGKAIFGPIVSPAPTGPDALALWEAVRTLVAMPAFFELKRNRSGPPQTA